MKRWLALASVVAVSMGAFAQSDPEIKEVTPASGPSSGGTLVAITGSGFEREVQCLLPCPTTVLFGNIEVPVKGAGPSGVVAVSPAHAPGPIDITVNVPGKAPATRSNAFTFTPGLDDRYESVLLPIYLDSVADGAFGSRWKTDLWMRNNGSESAALAGWPCDGACPPVFPWTYSFSGGHSLHNLPPLSGAGDGNPSRVLYVTKEEAAHMSFRLRFADLSRSAIDGGVEMPVIRQSEMLEASAQLFDVPLVPSFRAMLRVYETAYPSSRFRLNIYAQAEGDLTPAVHTFELTSASAYTGPLRPKAGYVQFDLSGLLRQQPAWPQNVRIEIEPLTPGSRYWAFVSITNNDTQVVTLVTPQ